MSTNLKDTVVPKLSEATLGRLSRDISRPHYNRQDLTPGIVHIGVGNFHRAHQSWYLHKLLEKGGNTDWAILGAGVLEFDRAQRDKLVAQDFMTTLIELSPQQRSVEIIGSMIGYVPVELGNAPLISAIADPRIRIVSMTVTESGYYVDPATQEFDASHEDIIHDADNPSQPRTVFGAIVEAARLRKDHGLGPVTIMSCDNLLGNGNVARSTIVRLAKLSNPALAEWIASNCTFPNSMVDCIVPATSDADRAFVQKLGFVDDVPVTHENFRQWVMEDSFCAGRPTWEEVGVTISDNVHGYETQKIRILNAGHQILANIAEILGIETVAAAMEHRQLHSFFKEVIKREIVPNISPVPGVTPTQYLDLVSRRFQNPAIVDTIRRIAFDGSARHPGMILPNVRDGLSHGTSVSGLSLVEAAWAHMCAGRRNDGTEILPNDPHWDELNKIAIRAKTEPTEWINQANIYGELSENRTFRSWFSHWLQIINDEGMIAALGMYLD